MAPLDSFDTKSQAHRLQTTHDAKVDQQSSKECSAANESHIIGTACVKPTINPTHEELKLHLLAQGSFDFPVACHLEAIGGLRKHAHCCALDNTLRAT